jgi:hypothetical protein
MSVDKSLPLVTFVLPVIWIQASVINYELGPDVIVVNDIQFKLNIKNYEILKGQLYESGIRRISWV